MRILAAMLLACAFAAHADDAKRAEQLADLAVARNEYLAKELAYTPATRAQAQAKLDELDARAGSLSDADLLVGLAQIGALADNAHSGVRWRDPQALPKRRLPLRLLWFPDALVVARATGDAKDLAGARVLAVEGLAPDALYERTKSLQGGNDVNRRKYLPTLIESLGVLHAMGLAKAPDRVALELRLPSGKIVERTVAMIANDPDSAEEERLWSPEPMPGEQGWETAIPADALPTYLADAGRPFRIVPFDDIDALYVQLRTNADAEGFPIAAFTAQVDAELAARPRRRVIVDLRFDVGGNLLTTLAFMRALPARASERTYLLVGHYTYSAGIVSAAAVKKAGGDKVTIVGDALGDRLAFWSEGDNVTLPHSRFRLRYTNGTFDLAHGCAAVPQCLDHLIGVNPVSLVPDIMAPLTSAAYLARRDPALEAVRADIARRD
ncbi:MAG TPA: hypothetical protein VJ724_16060 [Tahibacter sp.]|nr:hypothetical protein [Tahibacter sp.]